MRSSGNRYATNTGPVVDSIASRLTAMFALRDCWYEPFPFDEQLPRIEPGRILLPAAEPGVRPWTLDRGIELPVRYEGLTLGRFVLVPATATSGVALSPAGRDRALTLAARTAPAIAASLLAA